MVAIAQPDCLVCGRPLQPAGVVAVLGQDLEAWECLSCTVECLPGLQAALCFVRLADGRLVEPADAE